MHISTLHKHMCIYNTPSLSLMNSRKKVMKIYFIDARSLLIYYLTVKSLFFHI